MIPDDLCKNCNEPVTETPSGLRHTETGEHYCQPGDLEAAGKTPEEIETVPQAERLHPPTP